MTSVKMATSMMQTNLSLLRQHLSVAVGNSSSVVKAVAVAVTCGYFLTFAQSVIPYVAVTPGYVIPPNFWFWTFVTHAFIEVHFWDVLVDIAVVILCGKLLEPLWGALDMLLFFLIVNTGVAVVTAFSYLIFYLVSKNEEFLFETYIHGLAGYIAGFAVAVKQIMPDHVLVTSPFGKLRNTHIPLLLLFVVVTLRLAGLLDGPYPFMFGFGILISWIYLRFYQKHTNGNRGDMADNFGFPSFFPSQLQPFVAMFSNTVFLALVKIKICKKPQRKYDVSSPSTITITLPGTDQDAERRRQVALKALNERLNKTEQPSNWPSLVDEEGKASPENSSSPAKESLVKPTARQAETPEQQDQIQGAQTSTNTDS
ncbi:transmembrane protein 115-like [Pecten maximus]|uniref:transmembrane protein 115-like n=1 Tax=Pecten maximus TaxID=6579 RepID=UPI001457F4F4|nr:transmembrane protein 115-like [Pecten maximus]